MIKKIVGEIYICNVCLTVTFVKIVAKLMAHPVECNFFAGTFGAFSSIPKNIHAVLTTMFGVTNPGLKLSLELCFYAKQN